MSMFKKKEKFLCPRTIINSTSELATWEKPRGGIMGKYRSCSYCGSAHPDDFMQACRDGVEIEPTDKNYKAYIGEFDGKFYFQHLSVEQKKEFVDLLNAKKITIGFPGRFYNLPFFVMIEPLPDREEELNA